MPVPDESRWEASTIRQRGSVQRLAIEHRLSQTAQHTPGASRCTEYYTTDHWSDRLRVHQRYRVIRTNIGSRVLYVLMRSSTSPITNPRGHSDAAPCLSSRCSCFTLPSCCTTQLPTSVEVKCTISYGVVRTEIWALVRRNPTRTFFDAYFHME